MYDFLDRPATELDHGGRFLIWSMRTWVRSATDRICPASRLAPAFSSWRMLPGLPPFMSMMGLFNRHGLANFGFCALRCNHISEHEAVIISLICSLRDERRARLEATLALLVDEDRIGDLVATLSSLGQAMDAAGIYPARPSADPLNSNDGRLQP